MKPLFLVPVFLLGLVAVACEGDTTVNVPESQGESATTGIVVSGLGEVRADPDTAYLSIGIETSGTTVAETRELAAAAATRLVDAVKDAGVQDDDIRTVGLSISPQYAYPENKKPELVGYTASNQVYITIRELDSVSQVIDDAVDAGGDAARVQGISFGIDDPAPQLKEAREKAMADAAGRAATYAEGAGASVGAVLAITESSGAQPYYPEAPAIGRPAAVDSGTSTPIQPGQTLVAVSVTVRYAIGE